MTAPTNHYDTLGIARNATPAEIKGAYFKLVRVHSPEDDPDGFRRISEAYTVLSAPEARKRYDDGEEIAPEVLGAIRAAMEGAERMPVVAAAELVRVSELPGANRRARLGACNLCLSIGQADAALKIAERLAAEAPQDDAVCLAHGRALAATSRRIAAIHVLRTLARRDPLRLQATLELAWVLTAEGRHDDALAALAECLETDVGRGAAGLPAHVLRIRLAAERGTPSDVDAAAGALVTSIPASDADARRHATGELLHLGDEMARRRRFASAAIAHSAAASLSGAEELRTRAKALAACAEQLRTFKGQAARRSPPAWLSDLISWSAGEVHDDDWPALRATVISRVAADLRAADAAVILLQSSCGPLPPHLVAEWTALRQAAASLAPERPRRELMPNLRWSKVGELLLRIVLPIFLLWIVAAVIDFFS